MQITVNKAGGSTTHQADLVIEIHSEGSIMIQLRGDHRKLSAIASEFEDAETIASDDGRSWEGYGNVIVAYRMDTETVQIRITE